jgi:hypothetical protein
MLNGFWSQLPIMPPRSHLYIFFSWSLGCSLMDYSPGNRELEVDPSPFIKKRWIIVLDYAWGCVCT